jgi:LPXTG-motif cell wall-anchored protein
MTEKTGIMRSRLIFSDGSKSQQKEPLMRVVLRFLPTAILIGLLGGQVEAGLMLKLSDTTDLASVTIVDNGIGDLSPDLGVVNFSGNVGEFNVNVSTGLSTPVLGSGLLPQMDLNSIDAKLTGSKADVLTIQLTDTGWGPTLTPTTLTQEVGGTKSGSIASVMFNTFVDPTNTSFGTGAGTIKGTTLTFSGSPYSGTNSFQYGPLSGLYSVTEVATISANAGSGSVSYDLAIAAVPEPSSLTLAGFGIVAGIGLVYRKRRRASV